MDPLAGIDKVLASFGGEKAAKVRRGMFLHATLPRPPAGLTPHEVIHRQDKLAVRYYAPAKPEGLLPVVLVPSMINRAYILDLERDRSMVAALAAKGHPTYLVDWGVPGPEDAGEDVGYVLLELLHRAIDRACRHARSARALLVGYCQGGTLAAMYTALRPGRVAGLATFTAPVKFAEGGRFRRFAADLDVEKAIDPDGLLGVEVMKPAFQLLDPMGHLQKYIAIAEAERDPAAMARVLVRERWLEENVPMPGAFAREFLKNAYQDDALLAGTWQIRGQAVDLAKITCPLLVCACAGDFIAPPASVLPLAEATSSPKVRAELLETGHIGVVVGGFGPKRFYPLLDSWFREIRG